jgi:hypothetical protein
MKLVRVLTKLNTKKEPVELFGSHSHHSSSWCRNIHIELNDVEMEIESSRMHKIGIKLLCSDTSPQSSNTKYRYLIEVLLCVLQTERTPKASPPSSESLRCQICHLVLSSKIGLTRHMRIHTGERPFKCDQCDAAFGRSHSLNRHHKLHTGEKPFECRYCGKRYIQAINLKIHERTHHKMTLNMFWCHLGSNLAAVSWLSNSIRIRAQIQLSLLSSIWLNLLDCFLEGLTWWGLQTNYGSSAGSQHFQCHASKNWFLLDIILFIQIKNMNIKMIHDQVPLMNNMETGLTQYFATKIYSWFGSICAGEWSIKGSLLEVLCILHPLTLINIDKK